MSAPIDLGKYVVYDAIASGGMASVHLGRVRGPSGFSRTVAIKRLHSELARDPELREAFVAEARLAARIRHPNVVSVLDVVASGPELYLVMELASAVPLSQLLRRAKEAGRKVPPKIAVAIASAVLRGLHAAHELDVVHRDVSPQNVLVGADGVPRLVDFGIAKVESQATRGKALKGKPSYMAPEQLRGASGDRRADVYATSVVLWELLTGSRLFGGENDHAVALKVLDKVVDAPGRIVAGLPKQLDAVTLRGLARDLYQRFGSAEEMADALESAVAAASASETGSFVVELCSMDLDELDRRAQLIEELSDEAPTPARKRAIGVLALLLVLLGVALFALRPKPEPASAVDEPKAPAPVRAEPPRTEPPLAEPAVTVSAPAPQESAEPRKPPPRRPPAVVTNAARERRDSQPNCDPPYVIDAEGFQRMKPECL